MEQTVDYEQWWENNVVTGAYYTMEQFQTILSAVDSRSSYLDVVKSGYKVLDVGCGLGLDYEYYCKNNIKVDYTGVDTCEGFINRCREKYPQGRFEVQRSYDLSYEDKTFDIATARHVLEHLKEPYSTLQEMCRVAKEVAIIWFLRPEDEENLRLTRKGFYKNVYSKCKLMDYITCLGFSVTTSDLNKRNGFWHLTPST